MHIDLKFENSTVYWRVRKIAKSDYKLRHVCLSVRMEQLGPYWKDFHKM